MPMLMPVRRPTTPTTRRTTRRRSSGFRASSTCQAGCKPPSSATSTSSDRPSHATALYDDRFRGRGFHEAWRVIVRDTGEAWQLVLQTDHADLSDAFARAWADRGPRHDSVVTAARRHDDGWAVWERSPLVDETSSPVGFLDVHVPAHLAFYRARIAALTGED